MAGDLVSEIDELTVFTLAFLEGRGTQRDRARVRRELLAAACKRARRNPEVARLVALMMESRAARPAPVPAARKGNVYPLRPARRTPNG